MIYVITRPTILFTERIIVQHVLTIGVILMKLRIELIHEILWCFIRFL